MHSRWIDKVRIKYRGVKGWHTLFERIVIGPGVLESPSPDDPPLFNEKGELLPPWLNENGELIEDIED